MVLPSLEPFLGLGLYICNIETTVCLLPSMIFELVMNGLWIDPSGREAQDQRGQTLAFLEQHWACWTEVEGADSSGAMAP